MTVVTDRRGAAVWRAEGADGTAALKYGRGEAAIHVRREAAALEQTKADHFVASGEAEAGAGHWMVTRWLTGPSTWETFAPLRKNPGDGAAEAAARTAAVALCEAVAALHEQGWTHADIQPTHGIHTPSGVRLLDLAWAVPPGRPAPPGFRGGIVHLIAPELAETIEVGAPCPGPPSDIYALAGSLWACVTGDWPLDYGQAGIRREAGPDAVRAALARGGVPLRAADGPLLETLRPVLLSPAAQRPSAQQLAAQLTEHP